MEEEFSVMQPVLVYGQVSGTDPFLEMVHPEYECLPRDTSLQVKASYDFGRIVPIYSEAEGITQKRMRRLIVEVLKTSLPHLKETLPAEICARYSFPSLKKSVSTLHFPSEFVADHPPRDAFRRIVFEEFFILQLALGMKKKRLQRSLAPLLKDEKGLLKTFLDSLPFVLTQDQKHAIDQITRDLSREESMIRLLQGDVGSGKTLVALASAVIASSAGFQSVFMAPTDVLAHQHYQVGKKWLEPLGISVALLTGKNTERSETKSPSVVFGTHALFQEGVHYGRLGLVIIDEQHRFGVEQRAELLKKGRDRVPHLLLMTATPIPRTLSLTLYGDLDLSIIREKPSNRKPIKTEIFFEKQRPTLYQRIRSTVKQGSQVYIIYPLIEASERVDWKSATDMYEKLAREIFSDFRVALLHGRLPATEKEAVLTQFKEGQIDVLVSTTVVEVGIDVSNATLMVIEHPERLGLSQLHQLRGRVGRGEKSSECLLIADRFATERLQILADTDDGFEIAEADLRIRGPGEFLGTRQSGLAGFRVADIVRDAELLEAAKQEATRVLEKDPPLELPEHWIFKEMVHTQWKNKLDWFTQG